MWTSNATTETSLEATLDSYRTYLALDLSFEFLLWTKIFIFRNAYILCSVDRASRYIRVMKTNSMHYLSSVYFVSQPLHVSGIFVAHHQEANRQSTKKHNTYQLLYIYSIPPDDVFLMIGWPCIVVQPWLISNLMHKILIYLHLIHLLKSSTCFEHCPAHLQEVYVVIVYICSLWYRHSLQVTVLCTS